MKKQKVPQIAHHLMLDTNSEIRKPFDSLLGIEKSIIYKIHSLVLIYSWGPSLVSIYPWATGPLLGFHLSMSYRSTPWFLFIFELQTHSLVSIYPWAKDPLLGFYISMSYWSTLWFLFIHELQIHSLVSIYPWAKCPLLGFYLSMS